MREQTEVTQNLRNRLRNTLTESEPPEFPIKLKWILEMRLRPRDGSTMIGMLPIELQHLCVLVLKLEEEFFAEVHRRCVELLGEEEYDHEVAEFMIHQQVESDSRFNQAPKVWKILKRRVSRHWRYFLVTPDGHDVIFYIDQHFRLFKTPYYEKTHDEIMADIMAKLEDLDA